MYALIFRFFDICLLRAGPQDLPASAFLLRAVVIVNLSISMLALYSTSNFQRAFWGTLLDFAVLVLFLQLLLRVFGFLPRFTQTLIAIMGVDLLIGIIGLPFSYAFLAAQQDGQVALLSLVMLQLIWVWVVIVNASIFRHAMNFHLGYGLVFSITYFILIWVLDVLIFYTPANT